MSRKNLENYVVIAEVGPDEDFRSGSSTVFSNIFRYVVVFCTILDANQTLLVKQICAILCTVSARFASTYFSRSFLFELIVDCVRRFIMQADQNLGLSATVPLCGCTSLFCLFYLHSVLNSCVLASSPKNYVLR